MIVMQFKRLQEKEGAQTRRADELSYFFFVSLMSLISPVLKIESGQDLNHWDMPNKISHLITSTKSAETKHSYLTVVRLFVFSSFILL